MVGELAGIAVGATVMLNVLIAGPISEASINPTRTLGPEVYDLSKLITSACFKGHSGLARKQQIEWNNRVVSTLHALFITVMSLYFAFWSDLYSSDQHGRGTPHISKVIIVNICVLTLKCCTSLLCHAFNTFHSANCFC